MGDVIKDDDSQSDEDVDFDAIAEEAVKAANLAVPQVQELGLNIGIRPEQLYLTGRKKKGRGLKMAAVPGRHQLDIVDFSDAGEVPAPETSAVAGAGPHDRREVRGAPARPLDDSKLRRKERKQAQEEQLKGWFGMQKQQLTPELEKELKALKLRGSVDPKRFYKANDSKELPKYFHVAYEVGGGLAPAGEKPVAQKRGRSFLDEILHDSKVSEYTYKRLSEVNDRGFASANSGHGLVRKKGKASTHRGGGWKKRKK
mmetsp:Transcript_92138/g.168966  ORF Transcript_92138/g.168966 Transcript_92138/m.168966 type:complete len:257 (-) Transcript_92138:45-815(-)